MKKFELAMRVPQGNFNTPSKLSGLIEFCKVTNIKELQLVPTYTPFESAFLSKKNIVKRRDELKKIIAKLAKNGIEGHVSVLRTFYPTPFKEENIGFKQPRMDIDRKTHPLTPCPLDKNFLDYIKFLYREFAKTGTRAIEVDDDFRYQNISGLGANCFCPLHIKEFNRRNTLKVTFEDLKNSCAAEEISDLKIMWMEFKHRLLVELALELRKTIDKVNPECRIGLMLTSTEIAIPDARNIREITEAFSGKTKPLIRPGFGWYTDYRRLEPLHGLADSVYQVTQLPGETDIQPEVDLWCHTGGFNKANNIGLDFQIKINLAFNMKKINLWAFNPLHKVNKDHFYVPILKKNTKIFSKIAAIVPDNAKIKGIQTPFNSKTGYLRSQAKSALKIYGQDSSVMLWRLGIPFTFEEADTVFLTKDCFPLERQKLQHLIENKNVILEGSALKQLKDSGNIDLFNLDIVGYLEKEESAFEHYHQHSICGELKGENVHISSIAGRIPQIKPSKDYKIISVFGDIKERFGHPATLISRNAKNRIAIIAASIHVNSPHYFLNYRKQPFMQRLFEWVNAGPLPAMVDNAPDVCPVVLDDFKSKTRIISLLNVSLAPHENFHLKIASKNKYKTISYVNENGRGIPISDKAITYKQDFIKIKISGDLKLYPFQVRFIRIKY